MPDRELGFIELTGTTRIVFTVNVWKGQSRGNIRKWVTTDKYTGPTKSGMSLGGALLIELLAAVRKLQATLPAHGETLLATVGKTGDWEIRITVIPPDAESSLPSLDIREFVDNPRYTGPTKSGVRFPWDKLRQFGGLLEALTQDLGAATKAEDTLFPEVQPDWLQEVPGKDKTGSESAPAIPGLDGAPLKDFPNDFLPNGAIDAAQLKLPDDSLSIAQDRDGRFFVASDSGFHHVVRNEVEGKFLLYAHHRGHRDLKLPKAMFPVFSTVASYEKYCRELRQKLVRNLEARSRNHQLAELMARQTFEAHGLPAL
jgi:hypothetical protein